MSKHQPPGCQAWAVSTSAIAAGAGAQDALDKPCKAFVALFSVQLLRFGGNQPGGRSAKGTKQSVLEGAWVRKQATANPTSYAIYPPTLSPHFSTRLISRPS